MQDEKILRLAEKSRTMSMRISATERKIIEVYRSVGEKDKEYILQTMDVLIYNLMKKKEVAWIMFVIWLHVNEAKELERGRLDG